MSTAPAKTAPAAPPPSPAAAAGRRRSGAMLGATANAVAVVAAYGQTFGEPDVHGLIDVLNEHIGKLREGSRDQAEAMLLAQAHALQSIFTNLSMRAAKQGQVPAMEACLRLALKAQNQSRMTLETLANIKNPPVVIARQANIAQGHQQVNNHTGAAPPGCAVEVREVRSRTRKNRTARNELLEGADGQGLDPGAAGQAGRGDPALEAVGARHRPPKR